MSTEQVSLFLALQSFMATAVGVVSLALVATGRAERLRPSPM